MNKLILSLLAGFLIVIIYLTQTRTALASIFLSLFLGYGLAFVFRKKRIIQFTSKQAIAAIPVFAVIFACAVFYIPKGVSLASSFIYKGTERSSIEEAFYASRGKAVEAQWNHFLEKPLTGHGFGVYPSGNFPTGVVEFWGIPISAPVEKGVLPTMLLEETGITGTFFFLLFFGSLTCLVIKNAAVPWLCMYLNCFFINMGEAVFFSVGGIGMFYLLLIGLSSVAGNGEDAA